MFADALDDEIVASQPIYKGRGARDTTNATDTVVSATSAAACVFSTQQMTDGALLAYKTIILSTTSCALS